MPGIVVEIGADVAELLSKLKDAGAGFDAFTARTKSLAEQMLGTSDDAKNALTPGLDGLAGMAKKASDAFLFLKDAAEQAFRQAKEALGAGGPEAANATPPASAATAETPAPARVASAKSAPLGLQAVPKIIEFPQLKVDDSAIQKFKLVKEASKALMSQLKLDMKEVDDISKKAKKDQEDWKKSVAPFVSAFDQGIKSVIAGTKTLDQAMKGMAQSLFQRFIDNGVKFVEDFAVQKLRELTLTQANETAKTGAVAAGEQARLAVKQTGAAEGAAVEAAAGSATVMADANKAFSGAYSAVVGIPYIGPILAPIAGATAFAAVAAYDIFSAEGGYDIPAGLNPMTQLHQKEMVLPAEYADVIRAMAGGDNALSGGGTHHHYNVDLSGASFGSGIKPGQMKDMVVGALKQAHRELRFA